ncbi:hypothetical protein MTR67_045600 [Solanum verrucosum]|uniref:Uncharacterized protein n=1 Tax=Solanum verrucosum TaxID=315347 RepID=A0AAF0UUD1_SOLVR|nr:hypothetical protein MTR67_045600 [Solanum verrucosum]
MKLSNNLIVLIHCLFDILVNEVRRLFSSDKNGSDDDPEDHPDDDDARPEGKDDDEFDEETVAELSKTGAGPLILFLNKKDLDRTLFLLRSYLRTHVPEVALNYSILLSL